MLNRILEHSTSPAPTVGMGATVYFWTDRHAATVIKVSPSGKTVWLQEDAAIRTDANGMSEVQSYDFKPDPNGRTFRATLRKNGTWKAGSAGVTLGRRNHYHDFSF